ncbi:MAG: EVE domain-containing protein [Herpetosiphon sp.]
MAYWLLKTEPSSYSWDDLVRDQQTVWDGVRNAQARIYLRMMKSSDHAFIYHSGATRVVKGIARVTSEPYADPAQDDPRAVVVDVAVGRSLRHEVSLATIKAHPSLQTLALIRQSRLSVMPVDNDQWNILLKLSET